MNSFRIVSQRGAYRVEQIEADGQPRVVGTWRTEEDAVSHLRKLEAEERRATYKPMPGEIGGPPVPKR